MKTISNSLYMYCIKCGNYCQCKLSESKIYHERRLTGCIGDHRADFQILVSAESLTGERAPSTSWERKEIYCPLCADSLELGVGGYIPKHSMISQSTCPLSGMRIVEGFESIPDHVVSLMKKHVPQITKNGDFLHQEWRIEMLSGDKEERSPLIICPLCFKKTKLNAFRGKIYSHQLPNSTVVCRASDMIAAYPRKDLGRQKPPPYISSSRSLNEGLKPQGGRSRDSLSEYPIETISSVRPILGGLPSNRRRH